MSGNGRIIVIGEALIDVVHRTDGRVDENPGGSPANVALTLGRLGDAPRLIAAVGRDPHGDLLREWLAASDVELLAVDTARTATATARLAADGSATYEFDIDWSLPDDVSTMDAGIVHTGSIGSLLDPGAEVVRRLVEAARPTALITFDPNVRPALMTDRDATRRRIEALVESADVVKASDEDLAWLYPDRSAQDSASAWQRSGPAVVVVTHGGEGAVAVTAGDTIRVAGRSVQVVDTVGAGDTFMGALIHGLRRAGFTDAGSRERLREVDSVSIEQILDLAATAASITVSRPGADPPRLEELLSQE
ncbi:carbohydrate kinase [Microbacterium bovistercoris]|uniref:Carbohydrate kinase n=1 Tax=Microbacterium bovistercoris TaxID=2293570 RepID=A0A371NPD7_9MICO|nr:carbohydrate kinase [Microbacterium bovistercoris]REJ04052.1 carbohydrate kinase [Microbacterium bovistercoris]